MIKIFILKLSFDEFNHSDFLSHLTSDILAQGRSVFEVRTLEDMDMEFF